ncbi:phosphoribosylglycinamide formyltransferase [Enterococcus sp.]|jgi:phosphoribosylglycinamide formyltransferase-1|uniref:phosphoribosylglycinamide formyltransferase n=1 Tax=Enterococcus sp. TaxID=35783 RepID=UPI0025C44E8B|nr:phosphoribosylglycinamide formyltransferase [Enterococcus sp.]
MRIAVFASGNGSNFTAIADAIRDGEVKGATLALMFTDNASAFVLERAKEAGVPTLHLSPKDFASKADFEAALLHELAKHSIELIVLAGYMRIVGPTLLAAFPKKIINLHPSLLPSFPGKSGIADAYNYGVKVTGITIHYVDSGIDTGPIIAQEVVEIESEDTLESLEAKIHQLEHRIYPAVIAEIIHKGDHQS